MSLDHERLMDFWPALVGVFRNRLPHHSHTVWEDLAADTIERAIRNQRRYDERGNGPYSWLTVMASHIATDYLRRHNNRLESYAPLTDYGYATVDAGGERQAIVIDVRDALARVDEYTRSILTQRYMDDVPMIEILPQMSKGNSSKHHIKALRQMRLVMESVACKERAS